MKPGENETELWTVRDVAGYLKASTSWVYRAAASGTLPCLHIGALLRFSPEAIRAFAHGGRDSSRNRVVPFRSR